MNKHEELFNQKVKELVEQEYRKMKMSTKFSNQARLSDRCQRIIYNDWGIGNDRIWKLVNKYVEELIPNDMD